MTITNIYRVSIGKMVVIIIADTWKTLKAKKADCKITKLITQGDGGSVLNIHSTHFPLCDYERWATNWGRSYHIILKKCLDYFLLLL